MKKPSIHLLREDFKTLMDDLFMEGHLSEPISEKTMDLLFKRARDMAPRNRKMVISNDKQKRDAQKILMSSRSEVTLFNRILQAMRTKRGHRGFKLIKEGSKDWGMMKEAAGMAVKFCNDFDLEKDEGFKEYIDIVLSKIKRYNLSKFNTLHEAVYEEYEAILYIEQDANSNLTQKAHSYYVKTLINKIGFCKGYEEDFTKYRYFVELAEFCKENNVAVETYIKAQFEGLAYANGVPQPPQLIGSKAQERLSYYLYQNNIQVSDKSTSSNDIEYLKNLRAQRDDQSNNTQ